MYRLLILSFVPDQINRGRKSGFGVWRVVDSQLTHVPAIRVLRVWDSRGSGAKFLAIPAWNNYRKGQIINPVRAALDFVREVRTA